jgi:hypothetical protein
MDMTNDPRSFISHRSGGVRHPPEADIESIRQLLRGGYGTARSILKELIQNAEDAGASRMDVYWIPGDPASPLSLLTHPSLIVSNNGNFTQENRDAITQISLGTKGTEERAIGRFGKGLKSIFAWSEAFFIIARTDPKLGWPEDRIVDFFNPWYGWRHGDWDDQFQRHNDLLVDEVERQLCSNHFQTEDPWLAFWFPLREDCKENQECIHESFPGTDPEFCKKLARDTRYLVPSLVSLRNLQQIRINVDHFNVQDSLVLEFPEQSERIPAPDTIPGRIIPVAGDIHLGTPNNRKTTYRYCGFAGRLPDESVIGLKTAADWPKVVGSTPGQTSASCPVKGEPHFATMITSHPTNDEGSSGNLDVRWCVFFPVGKQPQDTLPLNLVGIRRNITINLHGFFFLDSERLRVDGLEELFNPNSTTIAKTCLKWNEVIATDGTLARLPGALASFSQSESLTNAQCLELVGAIRNTNLWANFKKPICHLERWLPRWRTGKDTWVCIPSKESVFLIPSISRPDQILQNIPMLQAISEECVLVANSDGTVPGLYWHIPDNWPESLASRLLMDVHLRPTGEDATAVWLNDFLNHLHRTNSLSAEILNIASEIPLLTARDVRTTKPVRLSARQWSAYVGAGHLFHADMQPEGWLRLLSAVLPDWSCLVAKSDELPMWFTRPGLPTCDGVTAAQAVLSQCTLGSFVDRAKLFGALAALARRDSEHCLAMRFLLHNSSVNTQENVKFLFMPSTHATQGIWTRLIEQLLAKEGGTDSWRLLHEEWSSILSPQLQRELNISTIDADGAWAELIKGQINPQELEFKSEDWSTDDICVLIHGLFQAGQLRQDGTLALLRRLRVHTLLGHADSRVSIAGRDGGLDDHFVLNKANFELELPPHLKAIWQIFLSETKVVECLPPDNLASTVQHQLFRQFEEDGTSYNAELDWNYVVRRSLEVPIPSERAALIMEALSHGDQAVRGLGQKLKKTTWIPLVLDGSIAPDSVVNIEGLEDDLHRLLDPMKDGLGGVRSLPEWITRHNGIATLRNYLPRIEQAIELLGMWLADKPQWYLGLSKLFLLDELEPILSEIVDLEIIPASSLLLKLRRTRVRGQGEELERLMMQHILPAVLKPFDYNQGGRERIESILRRLQGRENRQAFDAYLEQACKDGVLKNILPKLSLVNQRARWVPARQLIWPSSNLDLAAQLCSEQTDILAPLHRSAVSNELPDGETLEGVERLRGNQLTQLPDFEAEADKLVEYLQPFRNGNIGENLPAALVAVLGGHPRTLELLQELLQAGLHQNSEDFITLLLGENRGFLAENINSARFLVDVVRGAGATVESLTGERVTVEFTKEITTLIVGDPSDLWRHYYYQSRPDSACHRLRLRWIDNPDEISDPVAVFASTIETILLKIHCNGVSDLCPTNIKEQLADVADAGQADLRRSRSYLLDIAEARLKELGVKGISDLDVVLEKFTEARQARVDADFLSLRAPTKARQRREDASRLVELAKEELVTLLESDEDVTAQTALANAVRHKMTDFQYSVDSVAFELFQNADDALAELREMQGFLHPESQQFVLRFDGHQRTLEIVHWGRAINKHQFPGFEEGAKRGFDQDLQKMLTLNFSDKGFHTPDHPASVTGRFGLGFKSVLFIADQPEVISGRLAFQIRGGFFPVPLIPAVAEQLRISARQLIAGTSVPTLIRLQWEMVADHDKIGEAIDNFERNAPLLTIFSRHMHTLVMARNGVSKTWTNVERPLTNSRKATYVQVGPLKFFSFRCLLHGDQRPATVLFQLNANGISQLPKDATGVWITTPTSERSDLMFALNAPFCPDVGRQRLALNNLENHKIAIEIGRVWGDSLVELFDETCESWERFANNIGLHFDAKFTGWWQQLWKETTRVAPVLHWDQIREGGQVLSWIAWGKSAGAMRRLLEERPAVPTELPGHYSGLVNLRDVQFNVSGLLADIDNGCFERVSTWESTTEAFPIGRTVGEGIGEFLRSSECLTGLVKINLESVISAAAAPRKQVPERVADRIGRLISECESLFQSDSPYAVEVQRLFATIKEMSLISRDGIYRSANELICSRSLSDVIEADEALRASFAPDSAILSANYSDFGLKFFVKARGQLAANAITLATWIRIATDEQLVGAFDYLTNGELGQQVADQLARPWLEVKKSSRAWHKLQEADQQEIERKFMKGCQWPLSLTGVPMPSPFSVIQVMDARSALGLVSQWWNSEKKTFIKLYEDKTYPSGFPGKLPWPNEVGWDANSRPSPQACWLMLFIHAALVPLGFNQIGRDQSFSQFLVSNKWLDVFAEIADHPQHLLNALNQYLDGFVQNTQYHFQMRQFIPFYAVARHLEPLLLSLKEAERSSSPAFHLALAPRANPALTGTGIDAPPLTGMLGIGSCHLLRELYRLKILSNPLGYPFAFTPIRKVRRLCMQLFGIAEGLTPLESSPIIFENLRELGEQLGLDPTFDLCFDLPLQFLAQDADLRATVLNKEFEVEDLDDEGLDGAPSMDPRI